MRDMLPALDPASTTPARQVLPEDLLDADLLALLEPSANCRAWIDRLLEAGHSIDALRVLTRVLPKRYSLAWACECLKAILVLDQSGAKELDRGGVAMAERWLLQPTEEHRRAALDYAERGRFSGAGAWIAAAAGWADGSLAPKEYERVPPPDSLTGEAVLAALIAQAFRHPESSSQTLASHAVRALSLFGTPAATAARGI